MSSADKLTSAIEIVVKEYIKTKYNVTLDELIIGYMSFHKIQDKSVTLTKEEQAQKVPEKKTINEVLKEDAASKKQKVSAKDKPKCIHPIAKGEKKGQPCGVSVSDESKTGNYCKKHLTQESVETKAPSKAVVTKKKEEQPLNKFTKEELKEKIEKRTTEIEVRRNKFGNWEHQGSGILIDRDTRKAYGKQEQDASVSPLTEEDIELCKTIGFKYILPDNIKSKNEDMEEDEDEDMEEDEDLDIDDDIEDEEDD